MNDKKYSSAYYTYEYTPYKMVWTIPSDSAIEPPSFAPEFDEVNALIAKIKNDIGY